MLAVAVASRAVAQVEAPTTAIRTVPAVPMKGTLAWIVVRPRAAKVSDSTVVEGDAAGEPLHFSRASGRVASLVGIPLEGPESLEVVLRIRHAGVTDTMTVRFGLTTPMLEPERLRVAPSMATPDSAARARIEREVAQSRALSGRSHGTSRLWSPGFRLPRPSRITSVYGTPREYNGAVTSRHLGTDFAGAVGAPVAAASRAVVALVANFYLAGHAVYLDHGGGLVTGYFHLSRVEVVQGDTVRAGQRIGRVGQSGRVTGPHLHWIARYGAVTVDPMSLVRLPAVPY